MRGRPLGGFEAVASAARVMKIARVIFQIFKTLSRVWAKVVYLHQLPATHFILVRVAIHAPANAVFGNLMLEMFSEMPIGKEPATVWLRGIVAPPLERRKKQNLNCLLLVVHRLHLEFVGVELGF